MNGRINRIVILANGEFPVHCKPLSALKRADVVVCCDGAADKLRGYGDIAAEVCVVGDGDSYQTGPEDGVWQIMRDADQETNDLTKAFRYVLHHYDVRRVESVTILGATGLREDHTLGNISLLGMYRSELDHVAGSGGVVLQMMTNYGFFTAVTGGACLKSFPRQQVSIFSLTSEIPVTVGGLQYPIEHRRLHSWWEGTLNAALGDSFDVQGGILLVYQTWEEKE